MRIQGRILDLYCYKKIHKGSSGTECLLSMNGVVALPLASNMRLGDRKLTSPLCEVTTGNWPSEGQEVSPSKRLILLNLDPSFDVSRTMRKVSVGYTTQLIVVCNGSLAGTNIS